MNFMEYKTENSPLNQLSVFKGIYSLLKRLDDFCAAILL